MDRKILKFTLKNICMVDGCGGKADSSHLCEDHRGIRIESDPPRTEQVPVSPPHLYSLISDRSFLTGTDVQNLSKSAETNTRGPLFNTSNYESHKRRHDPFSGPTNPKKKMTPSEPAAIDTRSPLFGTSSSENSKRSEIIGPLFDISDSENSKRHRNPNIRNEPTGTEQVPASPPSRSSLISNSPSLTGTDFQNSSKFARTDDEPQSSVLSNSFELSNNVPRVSANSSSKNNKRLRKKTRPENKGSSDQYGISLFANSSSENSKRSEIIGPLFDISDSENSKRHRNPNIRNEPTRTEQFPEVQTSRSSSASRNFFRDPLPPLPFLFM